MESASPSRVTAELCALAASLRFEDLPGIAIDRATAAAADVVGCALAGIGTRSVAPVLALAAEDGGATQATVFGHAQQLPAASAALVNGTAGHSLDFDDISGDMYGHPSVVLWSALFATAEKIGATGREVIAAYAAGFEVAAGIGRRVNPGHYDRGWHATATIGGLAAAVAVARLLELPAQQIRHALGIAASQVAGMRRQFGTDAKPLHAGLAARVGVQSGLLAARGMAADPAIFDGAGGFADLYGGVPPAAVPAAAPGLALVAKGLQVKRHACCAATHTAIDAVLDLARRHDVRVDEIAAIECSVNALAADVLTYHAPRTVLEAKFSLEYCVAVAVLHQDCGLAQFTQARVDDPRIRELAARVTMRVDPGMPPRGTTPCRMTMRMRDGSTLTADVDTPRGSPGHPLAPDELRRKFLECATLRIAPDAAASLFGRLLELPNASGVREIAALTCPRTTREYAHR